MKVFCAAVEEKERENFLVGRETSKVCDVSS